MKKILTVLVLFLLPVSGFAAGPYDGIWETSEGEYATVNQNGNSIVVVSLDPYDEEWEAYQGDLVGNSATLVSVVFPGGSQTIRVDFTSTSSAQVTTVSCSGECDTVAGDSSTAVKIF